MRKVINLETRDLIEHQELALIFKVAFPEYKGRKFKVEVSDSPLNVKSYWDGGSRDYFVFVRLSDQQVFMEVPAQSMFDKQIKGADSVTLPPGMGCVEHSIFRGKDMGLTLHLTPENSLKLIPDKSEELSEDEAIVLVSTSKYKNTYGGETNIRFREASRRVKITQERWDKALESLIEKKLLRKNGSITPYGRNAIDGSPLKYKI